jgi:hypothetical protein
MAIKVDNFLTACLLALGDSSGATWSRTDRILPWAIEAVRGFQILRPMLDDHTAGASTEYFFDMAEDFREGSVSSIPSASSHPST